MTVNKKRGISKKQPEIIKHEDSAAKAESLGNSVLFKVYRVSDFPEVKQLIDIIYDQMKSDSIFSI